MAVKHYRISVEEYRAMAPIFPEEAHLELVNGELLEMSPIGPKHIEVVNNLNGLLNAGLGARARISVQNPVALSSHDAPQPDIAVLRPAPRPRTSIPQAADVFILIEVSDTTLPYDIGVKLPLYARNGVEEVWIVDVDQEIILQHTEPIGDHYGLTRTVGRGSAVTSTALPELTLHIDDILP
jgi:Uma2 family endonuclease